MASVLRNGFELNQLATVNLGLWDNAFGNTWTLVTSPVHSGVYAARFTGAGDGKAAAFLFSTQQANTCYYLWVFRIAAFPTDGDRDLGLIINSGATSGINLKIRTTGVVRITQDGVPLGASGADSAAISLNTWYSFELKNDGLNGLASTRLNGTAIDTDLAVVNCNNHQLRIGGFTQDATLDFYLDSIAVNDNSGSFQNSWVGSTQEIIDLHPNAVGDNSGWTPDTGANYTNVDEIPPNDATDKVRATTLVTDDYNMDAVPAAMASDDVIDVVLVGVRFAGVGALAVFQSQFVMRIKATSGGTVEESPVIAPPGGTIWRSNVISGANNVPRPYPLVLYDLPGASTTAWTPADLGTMQAGMRVTTAGASGTDITAVWVVVSHHPAALPKSLKILQAVNRANTY